VPGKRQAEIQRELSLERWLMRRSFQGSDYAVDDLARRRRQSVTVILPARETAATIGRVVGEVLALKGAGLVDEVVVVDADSADGSAAIAADLGARVLSESALLPEHGPPLGKGDAMWRALAATDGDVVVYADSDTREFDRGFVVGLLGPLLTDGAVQFVKAAFRRPFAAEGQVVPDEGGRVNELVARPVLNVLFPELAGFAQPLAGEVAARRDLLERLAFPVGYGVEIANLIDALQAVGQDALAQVHLGSRQNVHQSLRALVPMAYAVLVTALRRADDPSMLDAVELGSLALPLGTDVEVARVPLAERAPVAALRSG
jgi:glucosyl-3-phosphoglycerate synthase